MISLTKFTALIYLMMLSLASSAQKHKLYYYLNPKDSLLGVINAQGNIIIAAQYSYWLNMHSNKEQVKDSVITFYKSDFSPGKISASWGDVYDRRGNFLYHPLAFDNGPDYFVEEYARCVQDYKAGFVNRHGEVVIQPLWDWVTPFNYGYAFVCNGCFLSFKKDEEHPDIIYPTKATMCYINKWGEQFIPSKERIKLDDIKVDGGYLPNPFLYTKKQAEKLNSFQNYSEVINRIFFSTYDKIVSGPEGKLKFEIIESSTFSRDKFLIQAYQQDSGKYSIVNELLFEINEKGDCFYKDHLSGTTTKIGLWIKRELKNCEWHFRNYPEAANKFDIHQYWPE